MSSPIYFYEGFKSEKMDLIDIVFKHVEEDLEIRIESLKIEFDQIFDDFVINLENKRKHLLK